MNRKIFQQLQIARAVEMGLGVSSPKEINLISADDGSMKYRDRIAAILSQG